ncbi:S-norcoclaurine synthase 1-like [Magnolia sinica]|uniref:S-norcoclaurine synthase 1-like n=1 Tax=Magnolia sinica TaxID=86752 RepID=UPI002658D63D|nr:S-norcoclaurine synthase 1-like [Magnolia sinica]
MEIENGISESFDYGGSLPVRNVQDLAAKISDEIPQRYIRPEIQVDSVSYDERLEIPVVDLSRLFDQQFSQLEMAKLHQACQEWGFFQLINHGVADEVIERMKADIDEFFKLPLEEKMAHSQPPNSIEGYGQAFVVSDDQKLDWGDMLFLMARPIPARKMSLWPTHPPSFRNTLDKYSLELERVEIRLLGLMAQNLGLDPEKLKDSFVDGAQGVRMNYYPPCPQADKVLGISPHSDSTGLTLLVQVNEVQGLQIRKDGKWVPVKPIPGAFIVNIGDVLEILSNGVYRSIEHRAVINTEKERLSIAAFHSPAMSTAIGPLPDLTKDSEAYYKTVSNKDYVKFIISSKLDGKSTLDAMKLIK